MTNQAKPHSIAAPTPFARPGDVDAPADPFAGHVQDPLPHPIPGGREYATQICEEHGVDLLPTANGGIAVAVQGRYQQGSVQDRARIERCLAALEQAGISTKQWRRP